MYALFVTLSSFSLFFKHHLAVTTVGYFCYIAPSEFRIKTSQKYTITCTFIFRSLIGGNLGPMAKRRVAASTIATVLNTNLNFSLDKSLCFLFILYSCINTNLLPSARPLLVARRKRASMQLTCDSRLVGRDDWAPPSRLHLPLCPLALSVASCGLADCFARYRFDLLFLLP